MLNAAAAAAAAVLGGGLIGARTSLPTENDNDSVFGFGLLLLLKLLVINYPRKRVIAQQQQWQQLERAPQNRTFARSIVVGRERERERDRKKTRTFIHTER